MKSKIEEQVAKTIEEMQCDFRHSEIAKALAESVSSLHEISGHKKKINQAIALLMEAQELLDEVESDFDEE
jgi:hypothetical protein